MKIKMLGTRGEIQPSSPYHSKHSGVLIDNELLFDIGEEKFLQEEPQAIFITHLHPDHAFFARFPDSPVEQIKPPIFGPEKYNKNAIVKVLKTSKHINRFKITPIPTHHSSKVASQAYLIEKGKKKILYTGDMVWIDKQYYHLLKNLDLIITEASFIRKGGMIKKDPITGKLYGHNGIPDLLRIFSQFTKTIVFTHFGSWFYEDIKIAKQSLKKLGKDY